MNGIRENHRDTRIQGNLALRAAKNARKDCFFTTLEMIGDELRFYPSCFRGKTVYCNCDDPGLSNFWKFFRDNFAPLGLKGLVSTCYREETASFRFSYDGKKTKKSPLKGNGDFRSPECASILEESDICCTNPPFSLFRDMIRLLVSTKKEFLIVGNMNAMCYAEVYSLFTKRKIWHGASIHGGDRKFLVPDDYPLDASGCGIDENGKRFIRVKGVRWFTNLPHAYRNPWLVTGAVYDPGKYYGYDNYDAINIDRVKDIPMDYRGVMGVPVSFLDKFNPDQFEIVGFRKGDDGRDLAVNGKCPYFRVLVKIREKA